MSSPKINFKQVPGWVYILVVFGFLYITGLHTEVIGQIQRLMLATGIKNADVPKRDTPTYPIQESPSQPQAGEGFMLAGLDGKPVPFESLRGKVVFLNIWATWCPPCIAEMPNIQSLYEKVDSDKISFVMLSVDEGSNDKVQKFIDKKGYTFPVYRPASQIPDEFQSSAIPTTFIISPRGKIMDRHEGMADYDTPEVKAFLEELAIK
jgi:thiol-disulfide isomerase/thioredoxin